MTSVRINFHNDRSIGACNIDVFTEWEQADTHSFVIRLVRRNSRSSEY
jgi:hypothetical protein